MTAVPANESARPAQPLKVVQAVVVSAEPGKELAGRSRVVRARDWCRHATSLVRLSGYPRRAFLEGGSAAVRLARLLAELLAQRGDLDGLRAQVDAGSEAAAGRLAELLTKQGRAEEAQRLRR